MPTAPHAVTSIASPPSLAQQNTRLLALAFVLMELVVIGLFAFWVLLPLARRSADDLAGLMVLSAQTWAELPPATRAAFEVELLQNHALVLRAEPPAPTHDEWHAPYFYLLEDALAKRTGHSRQLASERLDSGTWYWASVPAGNRALTVGVAATRIDSQPITAFFVALIAAITVAAAISVWLARRLTRPLAQLEAASALIGQGDVPRLLPETGPLEMARLSQRFNAMAQQVRDLLSTRTTLLAGVSHDLRSPLARMRLALEMLKERPDPGLIERMERDIEQMDRLIGQVLELARGLAHEAPVPTDVSAFLQQTADDFSTPTQTIHVRCPPQQLNVAAGALHRALGNLLQNALRYAPNQPVELVCEVAAQGLRFGVLDRGPGIAPEQLETVFEPFHRLETSRSTATGGAGLGLAIVRELARANGWQVRLQTRPGGGLQAWVEIITMPQEAAA